MWVCFSVLLVLSEVFCARTYERLTTTCRESKPISARLTVSSVAACKAQCNRSASCIAVDTDGVSCYTKSVCEGAAGECQGWCGYRVASMPPPPPPFPVHTTLKSAAGPRGIFVGAAGNQAHLVQDVKYASTLAAQYSLVTAENACKWAATQPQRDHFVFDKCNDVRDFALLHNLTFRGHNLCWGEYNPSWLEHGGFNATTKRRLLQVHASTVANYYGNDVYAWDVVNEAISDFQFQSGNITLKKNVWYPSVPDYIEVALQAARISAPAGVKLFYNDYNIAFDSRNRTLRPST